VRRPRDEREKRTTKDSASASESQEPVDPRADGLRARGFFLAFFLLMLAVNQSAEQRAGALLGILAAIYPAGPHSESPVAGRSKTARRACAPTRCSCNAAMPSTWPRRQPS